MALLTEIPIEEAVNGPDAQEWSFAISDELKSIIKNDTWIVVDKPKGQKVIGSRIVLRNKFKEDGTLKRRKARIIARGFSQRPGIDFDETFAPVARLSSIRSIAALVVENKMTIQQFDITTAYLNGLLKEKVYKQVPKYNIETLENIVDEELNSELGTKAKQMLNELKKGEKVLLLKTAIYSLRQAGRCWNIKIDKEL